MLATLASVVLSGCAMLPLAGVAVEGFAGATRFAPEFADDPRASEEDLGYSLGLSLAVDVDFLRSSGLGAGMAMVSTQLPADALGERPTSLGPAAQYWFMGASDYGNDQLRFRGHMGLLFGQGDEGILETYAGAGASYHGNRGASLHVFAGPHWMAVREPETGVTYHGLGVYARVRLRQAFFVPCDQRPSTYGGRMPKEVSCR